MRETLFVLYVWPAAVVCVWPVWAGPAAVVCVYDVARVLARVLAVVVSEVTQVEGLPLPDGGQVSLKGAQAQGGVF